MGAEFTERQLVTASGARFAADVCVPRAMHRGTVVIAPGMRQPRRQPLLAQCAETLAVAGFVTVGFDWSEAVGSLPSVDLRSEHEHLAAAIAHAKTMSRGLKTFVVGKSLGGLSALELAASAPGAIDGIVLLTFPLHEAGRPEARLAHARRLITTAAPVLIVTGDADDVCDLKALASLTALMVKPPPSVVVPGGHSLDHDGSRRLAAEATLCWLKRWAGAG